MVLNALHSWSYLILNTILTQGNKGAENVMNYSPRVTHSANTRSVPTPEPSLIHCRPSCLLVKPMCRQVWCHIKIVRVRLSKRWHHQTIHTKYEVEGPTSVVFGLWDERKKLVVPEALWVCNIAAVSLHPNYKITYLTAFLTKEFSY